jgi:hypothetical protein
VNDRKMQYMSAIEANPARFFADRTKAASYWPELLLGVDR